jgi:hypothetical protein
LWHFGQFAGQGTNPRAMSFIKNKDAQGEPANNSLVLRGYVRTWLNQISEEYDGARALDWATMH